MFLHQAAQLESDSLNHTAAHHRISVRPKNRRPPKRSAVILSNSSIETIAENSDMMDSLELMSADNSSVSSSPLEPRQQSTPVSILRKSSSRLSRTSDCFEDSESSKNESTRKPPSVMSVSPDSLDALSNHSVTASSRRTSESIEHQEDQTQVELRVELRRKLSNRLSRGSDVFEELESKLPRRRSTSTRLSKSPDSLDHTGANWLNKSNEGIMHFSI